MAKTTDIREAVEAELEFDPLVDPSNITVNNITGQVAAEDKSSAPLGKNGKPMVWIPKKVGSNLPAHWADAESAEAREAQTAGSYSTKNIQDKQNQGISPGGN